MTKNVTIMLVDDNKVDLFIHNEVLKNIPLVTSVIQYAFAGDALSYLEASDASGWPDLILLDIHMPGMSGFDFLTKYEKLPGGLRKNCRIIMLSSSLDAGDHKQARSSGEVFGFLEKPLDVKILERLILA